MSNSDSENRNKLSRRQALLLSAAAGMGAALTGTARASDSIKTAAHPETGNCSTPRKAVANTGGENRWLPVKSPKPWDGEYPALIYGANCPQRLHDFTAIERSFIQD